MKKKNKTDIENIKKNTDIDNINAKKGTESPSCSLPLVIGPCFAASAWRESDFPEAFVFSSPNESFTIACHFCTSEEYMFFFGGGYFRRYVPRRIFLGSFSLFFLLFPFFLGGGVSSSGLRRGSFERLSRSALFLSIFLIILFLCIYISYFPSLQPQP